MSVTTILDYKVNEGDLKKWLGTQFGFVDGKPQFSYKVMFQLTPNRYPILIHEAKRPGQGVLGGERPKKNYQGNARTHSHPVRGSRLTLIHLV